MGAIIEVKYFNSFLLKKTYTHTIPTMADGPRWNGSWGVPVGVSGHYPVWDLATYVTPADSWVIEEARIRGGYNNTNVDYGVKAYLVEDEPNSSIRFNAMIYSGIFNSRTGINNSNVFSVGTDITRAADPINGSIQKLYAEDTSLIIFQQDKVSRAPIDKDVIYNAEGGGSLTASSRIIGDIIPYAGEYGISNNPESFAVYGYRKYFTDKNRNAVLRLSKDGITEISQYGMIDYFRDQFGALDSQIWGTGKAIGTFDIYNKQYALSLQQSPKALDGEVNPSPSTTTLVFDERILGWPSFFNYIPDQIFSLQSSYYSFRTLPVYIGDEITGYTNGGFWKHYDVSQSRNNFYGTQYDSSIKFVFNPQVSLSKVFKTINYEGSNGWEVSQFDAARSFELVDSCDTILSYTDGAYDSVGNVGALAGYPRFYAGFVNKEGKYFANLVNKSTATPGEVIFGAAMTGVKGYYATVTIETDDTSRSNPVELFAVSSNFVESSY
tara:strand:- start:2997 stop:4481 length:1485 start_codon:yes stop_codon:yes gene_type:complete